MLNAQQIQHYHQQGFLIVEPALDHRLLDRIVRKIQPHYEPAFQRNPHFATRLQDFWKRIDEIRELAVNANILAILQQLQQRRPRPFQTLNFPIGTGQPPHSDTIHFSCRPAGYLCAVWVALEDIGSQQGPLRVYPGSHLLPEYNMQDLGLAAGYENYPEYEKAISELVSHEGLQAQPATLRKGQALIWHANLLHGGDAPQDLSLSRHSQVTHYYFDDCEYYIPMLSNAEYSHPRAPDWIPANPPSWLHRMCLQGVCKR